MESKKNIFKAIAEFQQEVPVIHKATSGYNYTYTNLTDILKVINPLLKKNGLGFTQLVGDGNVRTIIFHVKSGESIETTTTIPHAQLNKMNAFQVLGSAITYIRRYALSAALGLVTDKDIDACGEQVEVTVTNEVDDSMRSELKKLAYDAELSEFERTAAFNSIAECNTNDMYYKIKGRLESLAKEPINPNATDIKKKVNAKTKQPTT